MGPLLYALSTVLWLFDFPLMRKFLYIFLIFWLQKETKKGSIVKNLYVDTLIIILEK